MSKIFLLNGPPKCGKDTAAKFLSKKYNGELVKLAAPIKRAVTAIYHKNNRGEFDYYDSPERKGEPQEVYKGKTCREVQIGVSESFLKPFHNDKGVFGHLLVKDLHDRIRSGSNGPFFVSDSGFRREAEVLIDEFGAENIFLFKIFRDGCSFKQDNDSRNYITLKDLYVREFDIENVNGNESIMYGALTHIVDTIL